LNWDFDGGLAGIIASWVISPIMSGCVGVIMYWLTHHLIVKARLGGGPRRCALIGQPILWTTQTFVIAFLILLKAQPTKKWAYSQMAWVAAIAAACVFVLVLAFLNPHTRRQMPSIRAKRPRKASSSPSPPNGSPSRALLRVKSIGDGLGRFLNKVTTGGGDYNSDVNNGNISTRPLAPPPTTSEDAIEREDAAAATSPTRHHHSGEIKKARETASHTTPFAWCTPFLEDFSRRHSSPALPFQRLTGKTFD
jgi:hypothetical protein